MTCLAPKEVAAVLGVSARTAQRLMQSGELPAFRTGKKLWRTTRSEVDHYIGQQLARYRRPIAKVA